MYELGTNHTKLWRSSKNEWFGGTPGFYWGNNNAKDLDVNLEYLPDPQGAPEYIPFVPRIARPGLAGSLQASTKARSTSSSRFCVPIARRWSRRAPWMPRS